MAPWNAPVKAVGSVRGQCASCPAPTQAPHVGWMFPCALWPGRIARAGRGWSVSEGVLLLLTCDAPMSPSVHSDKGLDGEPHVSPQQGRPRGQRGCGCPETPTASPPHSPMPAASSHDPNGRWRPTPPGHTMSLCIPPPCSTFKGDTAFPPAAQTLTVISWASPL